MGDCSEREGRPVLERCGGGVGAVGEEEFDDALGSLAMAVLSMLPTHRTAFASAPC